MGPVRQLRLVVTADDYEDALRFYRDVLGLPVRADFSSDEGRVTVLDVGQATLEIADPAQADYIDRVEVGRRVAGHVRVAFEVEDATTTAAALEEGGATVVAEPTVTPWQSLNARFDAPGSLHITVFEQLAPE
jgi:lactoylglutathione lyase